jgi:hypothetical protein
MHTNTSLLLLFLVATYTVNSRIWLKVGNVFLFCPLIISKFKKSKFAFGSRFENPFLSPHHFRIWLKVGNVLPQISPYNIIVSNSIAVYIMSHIKYFSMAFKKF